MLCSIALSALESETVEMTAPTIELTKRQQEIYDFIENQIANRGFPPTVREIGAHFKISSPNGVMCHLKALEKKGLITRENHASRAITLTASSRSITAGRVAEIVKEERSPKVALGRIMDELGLSTG